MSNSAFTPTFAQNLQDASATQSGLVNTSVQTFAGKKTFDGGAAIKGDTSGNAIAAGYVGEVLTATWTNQTILGTTTTLGTISNVQPGIYILMAKCDGTKGTSTRTVGGYAGTATFVDAGAGVGGFDYVQAQDTTSVQANLSTTIRVTASGTVTFTSIVTSGTSNVTSARGCLILVRIA